MNGIYVCGKSKSCKRGLKPLSRQVGTAGIVPESESESSGGNLRKLGRFQDFPIFLFFLGVFTDNPIMKRAQKTASSRDKAELDKIQSNLSYSYLHAVVSRAGGACALSVPTADGMGVDATLHFKSNYVPKQIYGRVDIDVQLKSTRQILPVVNGKISCPIESEQYRKYTLTSTSEFLLILFVLPTDPAEWLALTPQELTLKKCCYWTSLNEAPLWTGSDVTVRIPEKNLFNVEQLHKIITKISEGERLKYEP